MNVQLITTREVAAELGVSEATLCLWRRENRGPRYVRLDGKTGKVRYALSDVRAWVAERTSTAGSIAS